MKTANEILSHLWEEYHISCKGSLFERDTIEKMDEYAESKPSHLLSGVISIVGI